jgi:hypothetical protein
MLLAIPQSAHHCIDSLRLISLRLVFRNEFELLCHGSLVIVEMVVES